MKISSESIVKNWNTSLTQRFINFITIKRVSLWKECSVLNWVRIFVEQRLIQRLISYKSVQNDKILPDLYADATYESDFRVNKKWKNGKKEKRKTTNC